MFRHVLLLTVLSLLLSLSLPTALGAQDLATDYARISTPDVAAAVDFMSDVMGCQPLEGVPASAHHALLECARGTVVEIVHGPALAARAAPLRLRADDLQAAVAGLRHRKIPVLHHPVESGRLVHVDVASPWGQTLELIGQRAGNDHGTTAQLAAD